jgi:hypothetical protein
MRFNHFLKKNHRTESPNNILIVDTEANISTDSKDIQTQTFRLGYSIHLLRQKKGWSERGYVLRTIEDFWDLVDGCAREKTKLYVFAHNMAYDYAILKLDTYISSRHLEIEMRVIDSVFMIKAGNIVFLSSTNYYRQSLKELGIIFGLSKMDSPNFETVSDEKLLPYCVRDTEVLSHIIKQHIAFVVDKDLGSFKPTIAGQAMSAFRHRFMHHDLLVHNHYDILMMEKSSYRGGRCEVFKMGTFNDVTCLDINSMYPFVMKSFEFPTKLISASKIISSGLTFVESSGVSFDVRESDIRKMIESGFFVLADCHVILKKPCLAFKSEKLLFPVGKMHLTLTSPEIEYLLDNPVSGSIISFDECVFYEKANIFSEYVDFFYKLRCETDNSAINAMAKVMLNSLYGKFGQHNSSTPELVTKEIEKKIYLEMMSENDTLEILDDEYGKYVKLGEDLYHVTKAEGEFARDSIPIIASTVTAYARMILWKLILKAGIENVIYCDTDSLFVNSEGLGNLKSEINQTELGKLKVEKSGTCTIHGCKDYTFNGKTKLKGIKANAKKISDDTYIQYQFDTKNRRYSEGTKDGIVIVRPIKKKVSRNYDKGILSPSGQISPLIFDD